ncbi:MAG: response regulator, partial [Spirochaetales bacterium]
MSAACRATRAVCAHCVAALLTVAACASAIAQTREISDSPESYLGNRRAALPTVALWRDAQVVSLFGNMRIRETEGSEIDQASFGFIPDPNLFLDLPSGVQEDRFKVPGYRTVWLAFTVRNSSDDSDWALSSYRSDFMAKELVLVDERGERESWEGDRLAALERRTGIANIASIRIPLPLAERRTVYVRLEGFGVFLSDVRLWRNEALNSMLAEYASAEGVFGGAMAVLFIFSILIVGLAGRKHLPYAIFSCFAFLFVLVSLRGGGSVVMARGDSGGRFVIDLLIMSMVVAVETIFFPWSRRPRYWRVAGALLRGLTYLAVAMAPFFTRSLISHLIAEAALGVFALAMAWRGLIKVARIRDLESLGQSLWAIVAFGIFAGLAFDLGVPIDGNILWYHAPAIALFTHASSLTLLAAMRTMRTRNSITMGYRAAFERLARQAKAREVFAISTARAFLAPLDGMIGLLDEALDASPEAGVASVLSLARAETIRLSSLANNVLIYMRVHRSEFRLSDEPFNLAALLRATLDLTSHLVTGRNLETRLDVPIIEMRNDVLAIQQVVYNVLGRVMRTPGVSALAIRAESDTHLVHLDISDDGSVPSDLVPTNSSSSPAAAMMAAREYAGVAGGGNLDESADEREPLDMVVTARLSTLLGGSFSWRREGDRNRYTFVFPRSMRWGSRSDAPYTDGLSEARTEPRSFRDGRRSVGLDIISRDAETMSGSEAGTARKGGSVLVVDDEPLSLFSLKRRLESGGWNVEARVSALDALKVLETPDEKTRYSLILVDSSMPEMSGFAFCERVRFLHAREFLPIILVVDSMRPEEVERAFEAGANDYLVRPVGGRELLVRVKTHVDLATGVRQDLERGARMAEIDKFKTLGWLTAGVAHEINTPNNAMLRNVPLLKELWVEISVALERLYRAEGEFNVRGFTYEDLRREIPEILNDLYMGAQHIKKIVSDLKDYARGSGETVRELTDLNQVVSYAVRLLKHTIATSTTRAVFAL